MPTSRPIVLMTDFGTDGPFAGVMKGAIYAAYKDARIIDFMHAVPAFDIAQAAFWLSAYHADFPRNSVFVVVVDPEVGSNRDIVLMTTPRGWFLAPDNGVLTPLLRMYPDAALYAIHARSVGQKLKSTTFHGRDIFAPVAAALARGVNGKRFSRRIRSLHNFELPIPRIGHKKIQGAVLVIDPFGNLVTNITMNDLQRTFGSSRKIVCTGSGFMGCSRSSIPIPLQYTE